MKLIKRVFIGLIALVLALVGIAYLLPSKADVSRSITINASPAAIFPYVNSMQQTEQWSPWLHRDPETKLTYSGPESGVGNILNWSSDDPQVGTGSQEIVESIANQSVQTALDFGPMGTASAAFLLQPDGDQTQLTWGFTSELGMNPISRWMGVMMDRWLGPDYERGLMNLKVLVEGQG